MTFIKRLVEGMCIGKIVFDQRLGESVPTLGLTPLFHGGCEQ